MFKDKKDLKGTLKNDKARKILGFKPKVGLEKGISLYLKHLKNKMKIIAEIGWNHLGDIGLQKKC